MTERPLPEPIRPAAHPALAADLAAAERYAEGALAPATRKAYESDWRIFATWCAARGQRPVPAAPVTVAAFLAAEAERTFRPETVTRRAAAIAFVHRAQDHPNPCDSTTVRSVLAGIRRKPRSKDELTRRVKPLAAEPLAQIIGPIDTSTLAGLRDRALLLLGFAAALRRSELVALDVDDLEFDLAKGLLVRIRCSKTDQEGVGEIVAVPYARPSNAAMCPVRAVTVWLEIAHLSHGPVFRQMRRGDTLTETRLSDQSVALIVKRRAAAASLGAQLVKDLSGHSLRAGYATAAAAAGIEERQIANVTRHKNMTVLRRYIRTATAFDDVANVL